MLQMQRMQPEILYKQPILEEEPEILSTVIRVMNLAIV